jgi:hypothetical protein
VVLMSIKVNNIKYSNTLINVRAMGAKNTGLV